MSNIVYIIVCAFFTLGCGNSDKKENSSKMKVSKTFNFSGDTWLVRIKNEVPESLKATIEISNAFPAHGNGKEKSSYDIKESGYFLLNYDQFFIKKDTWLNYINGYYINGYDRDSSVFSRFTLPKKISRRLIQTKKVFPIREAGSKTTRCFDCDKEKIEKEIKVTIIFDKKTLNPEYYLNKIQIIPIGIRSCLKEINKNKEISFHSLSLELENALFELKTRNKNAIYKFISKVACLERNDFLKQILFLEGYKSANTFLSSLDSSLHRLEKSSVKNISETFRLLQAMISYKISHEASKELSTMCEKSNRSYEDSSFEASHSHQSDLNVLRSVKDLFEVNQKASQGNRSSIVKKYEDTILELGHFMEVIKNSGEEKVRSHLLHNLYRTNKGRNALASLRKVQGDKNLRNVVQATSSYYNRSIYNLSSASFMDIRGKFEYAAEYFIDGVSRTIFGIHSGELSDETYKELLERYNLLKHYSFLYYQEIIKFGGFDTDDSEIQYQENTDRQEMLHFYKSHYKKSKHALDKSGINFFIDYLKEINKDFDPEDETDLKENIENC